MDAIEQLKLDVRQGRIDADRLIDVIVMQQRQLEASLRDLKSARQRIEELEKQYCPSQFSTADRPPIAAPAFSQRHSRRTHAKLRLALRTEWTATSELND